MSVLEAIKIAVTTTDDYKNAFAYEEDKSEAMAWIQA